VPDGVVGAETPEPEPRPRPYQTAQTQDQKTLEENLRLGAQAGFLGMVIHSGFFLISQFRGAHWMLQSGETMKLAGDYNEMFNAVFPAEWLKGYDEVLRKFGPVFSAGLTTISIVGPRLAIDAQLDAAKNARVGVGAPVDSSTGAARSDGVGFQSAPAGDAERVNGPASFRDSAHFS